ncbi:MAG TPA: DUF1467 family protein [Rhodopseudomonas sp.]|uniref:DUF1467 family protein n=1 Tax=Rhodopseudomonas sp. TaxID=1078 RepID=UPI002ED8F4CB
MAYSISTALAIYFVLWWLVLFATLPFGVRNQAESGGEPESPGNDPGAPVHALMLRKALWTTVISSLIYGAAMLAYRAGYFNIERLTQLMGIPL